MNRLDFDGRIAVITGGAAGIGFAVAQRLRRERRACRAVGPRRGGAGCAPRHRSARGAIAHALDVADAAAVERATREALAGARRHRRAGVLGGHHRPEQGRRGNTRSTSGRRSSTSTCTAFLLQSRRRAGRCARATTAASSTSRRWRARKATRTRRRTARRRRRSSASRNRSARSSRRPSIRVNCVTPAAVRTAIFDQMTQQHIDFMLSKIPLGRFGTRRRDRRDGVLARERGLLVLDRRGVRPVGRARDILTARPDGRAAPKGRSARWRTLGLRQSP